MTGDEAIEATLKRASPKDANGPLHTLAKAIPMKFLVLSQLSEEGIRREGK